MWNLCVEYICIYKTKMRIYINREDQRNESTNTIYRICLECGASREFGVASCDYKFASCFKKDVKIEKEKKVFCNTHAHILYFGFNHFSTMQKQFQQ